MGLGKTVQTVLAARIALQRGDLERVLIVVPYSLLLNWEEEFQRWAPDIAAKRVRGDNTDRLAFYRLPVPILIASYEQIRMDALQMKSDEPFDLVVIDEAQRIKNSDSLLALACRVLPRKRAWALTGTPIENSVRDLVSVFRFLKPGVIRLGMGRSEIQKQMQPFFLRRTKAQVLPELPEIIFQDIDLELTGSQLSSYETLWDSRLELLHREQPATEIHLLALITKLKQLCNYDESSGESVKLDTLRTILESAGERTDKVIIFSQYVNTLKWLAARFEDLPIDTLHGGLTAEERATLVNRFENEVGPRVLFISLKAGGVGLNLQAASTVVLFDRWWNPAVEKQAIERAHRFGRKRVLHVFRFIVRDTIEEKIDSILRAKQSLFDEVIEDAENANVGPLNHADLAAILGLPASPMEISSTLKEKVND